MNYRDMILENYFLEKCESEGDSENSGKFAKAKQYVKDHKVGVGVAAGGTLVAGAAAVTGANLKKQYNAWKNESPSSRKSVTFKQWLQMGKPKAKAMLESFYMSLTEEEKESLRVRLQAKHAARKLARQAKKDAKQEYLDFKMRTGVDLTFAEYNDPEKRQWKIDRQKNPTRYATFKMWKAAKSEGEERDQAAAMERHEMLKGKGKALTKASHKANLYDAQTKVAQAAANYYDARNELKAVKRGKKHS